MRDRGNILKQVPVNRWIDVAIFVFILVFPLLGMKQFRVDYMNQFAAYMIFALSLDLIWGYTGLMSLGHALLFGLGGYCIGLCWQFQDGAPAFMTREGIMEIPALLVPMANPIFATAAGLLIPAAFAFIIGQFLFKSKVSGVFFTIITLALAQIAKDLIINQQAFTNGFNGLQGIPRGFAGLQMDKTVYYYFTAAMLILAYLFCLWLTSSRFGKVAVSVRENEARVNFLGYNSSDYKIIMYTISGFLAGFAGLLYAPAQNSITVEELSVTASTFVLIGLAIGGRGNLTGALLGTLLLQWAKVLLSEIVTDYWQLVLGAILLLVIFLAPEGIAGKLLNLIYRREVTKKNKPDVKTAEEEVGANGGIT